MLHSERASLNGFVCAELGQHLRTTLNRTDKVCLLEGSKGVPETYMSYLGPTYLPANESAEYRRTGGYLWPTSATPCTVHIDAKPKLNYLNRNIPRHARAIQPFLYISIFDPTHGRPARTALFPEVIACLKSFAAM